MDLESSLVSIRTYALNLLLEKVGRKGDQPDSCAKEAEASGELNRGGVATGFLFLGVGGNGMADRSS